MIAVIDYGRGNLGSVEKAFRRIGMPAVITQDPRSLEEAVEVANLLAPEHLELQVEDPEALLPLVRSAGAVFLGRFTPEVVGDYVAGPNHVLPTGGTARFASALGTEDFVKRMSVIQYTEAGLKEAGTHLAELARVEGLDGHGAAAAVRILQRTP